MIAFWKMPFITPEQKVRREKADQIVSATEQIRAESQARTGRHLVIQQKNHFIQSIFGAQNNG